MPHGFSTSVNFTSFSSRHQQTGPLNSNTVADTPPIPPRPSLTRPNSSRGRHRPSTASSIDPFGPRSPSIPPNTLDVQIDPKQVSFTPNDLVWDEVKKIWRQEDRAFTAQRATLRHAQSIPRLPTPINHTLPPLPTTESKQEVTLPSWMRGKAELQILGRGGESGAELKLYIGNETTPSVKHFIPPSNHSAAADYFNAAGVTQFLEITDIQMVHHSVFDRHHILSVRIPNTSIMAPIPRITSFQQEVKSQPVIRSGIFGLKKAKVPSTPKSIDRPSRFSTPGLSPDAYSSCSSINEEVYDQVIYLAFKTEEDRGDWFSLLRSFCRSPVGFRLHRRLELKVSDLHEQRGDNDAKQLKGVWANKEKIAIEVVIDDVLLGRSTWQKAGHGSSVPFWGETMSFEELPDFAFCMLHLYRQNKGQSVLFATVQLPLSSSFARPQDERYPVRSSETGNIIADLRMSVLFSEVAVQLRKDYALDGLFAAENGVRLLYYLSARGQVEGTPDLFARIGLADGSNLPRLLAMCRVESQANADTLFRSNTPLSKLLEACLRLRSANFLRMSLGPTVTRVFSGQRRSKVLEDSGNIGAESKLILVDLAAELWNNMYMNRNHFPNFLRHVFAKLFQSVKANHPGMDTDSEKLRYKALSSFLFLRLIGPALLRPHLFGLAEGLPTSTAQRTLTLLAKGLNALAFFTPIEPINRDDELEIFVKFITENAHAMVDYLSSFAIPLDQFQCMPPPPSPICSFVTDRCKLLPPIHAESVPQLTTAGPIDAVADVAILAEILYDRRSDAPPYPLAFLEEEALAERSAMELDGVLIRVHRRAIDLAGSEAADSENRLLRSSFSFDAPISSSPSLASRRRDSPGTWKWTSMSLSLPAVTSPPHQRRSHSPPTTPLPLGSVKQIIRVPEEC